MGNQASLSTITINSSKSSNSLIPKYPVFTFGHHLIETTPQTKTISTCCFNKETLIEKVGDISPEYQNAIADTLDSEEFNQYGPINYKHIHFINTRCESLLHVENKNGTYNKNPLSVKIVNIKPEDIFN